MNGRCLFALYDRVSDAPDAVNRLRHFILDLAVQGKLLEQNPADAPVSELLTQIALHKRQRGVCSRNQRAISTRLLNVDETLFNLPAS